MAFLLKDGSLHQKRVGHFCCMHLFLILGKVFNNSQFSREFLEYQSGSR